VDENSLTGKYFRENDRSVFSQVVVSTFLSKIFVHYIIFYKINCNNTSFFGI
jgi:hypothetical protein